MPPDYPLSPSRTYWAESAHHTLDDARENLWAREGKPKRRFIHYAEVTHDRDAAAIWGPNYEGGGPEQRIAERVLDWLHNSGYKLDAAIWSGMPSERFGRLEPEHLSEDVVGWLSDLAKSGEDRVRAAREYIEFAPPSINTPVRTATEGGTLRWQRKTLPEQLFDGLPAGTKCPQDDR